MTSRGGNGGNVGIVAGSGQCCGGDGGELGDPGIGGSAGQVLFNQGFSGNNASILGCTTFVKRPMIGSGAKGSAGCAGSDGAGGGGGGAGPSATAGTAGGAGINGVAGVQGGPGGGIVLFGAKNIVNGTTINPYIILTGLPGANGIDNAIQGNPGGNGGADGGGGGDGGQGGPGGHGGSGGAGGALLGYANTFIPSSTTTTWRNLNPGLGGDAGDRGAPGAPGANDNGCSSATCTSGGGGGSVSTFCNPDSVFKYLQLIKNNNPDPVIITVDEIQYGNADYTITVMKPNCANPRDGRIIKLNIGRPITTAIYHIFMEDITSLIPLNPEACIDNIYNNASYSINLAQDELTCNTCNPITWKLSCSGCFRNKPRWGRWGTPGIPGDPGQPGLDDFGQVDEGGEGHGGGPCLVHAQFNFMPIGCNQFQFMNMSWGNGTVFYSWDFGDGQSSADLNPTHQYSTPGFYNICLKVTNFINGVMCIDSMCLPVNINTISVTITGDNIVCPGSTKTITAQPSPAGTYGYAWNPSTLPSTQNVNVGAGTYTVTITDANGCTATATKTLTNAAPFTASITGNLSICPGMTTILTANPSGNYTYSWSTNPVQTSQSVTVGAGTYTVVVSDANGCTKTSVATVLANGTCCFEPDFCYQIDHRTLRINSVSPSVTGYKYKWFLGNGVIDSNTVFQYTYPNTSPQTNNYTVCLEVSKVINGILCCKRICKEIHLLPICNSTVINAVLDYTMNGNSTITPITSSLLKVPVGSYIKITYGSQPFAPLSYTGFITSLNSLPVPLSVRRTYTQDGTYDMCIQLIYTNGTDTCIDESCKTIVIDNCNTQASFNMKGCVKSLIHTFTPIANPNGTVTWDFGDGTTGNSTNLNPISHTYAQPGLYKVCMQVVNGKCSSKTCYLINANPIIKQSCGGGPLLALPNPNANPTHAEEAELQEMNIFQLDASETNDLQSVLFPNPSKDLLNLAIGSKQHRTLAIDMLTIDGKVIMHTSKEIMPGDNLLDFDVSQFQDGLYLMRIQTDQQIITKKFNVSH